MKKQIITGVSIMLLTVTAMGVYFVLQKNKNNQQLIREFEIEDMKISFVQPRGWNCSVFPMKVGYEEWKDAILCAKEVNSGIMNHIVDNYKKSKGNGPYYDEIVKNEYHEVALLFPEKSSIEKRQYIMDDSNFNTDYSKSQLATIVDRQFRTTIVTNGRRNASTVLVPGVYKNLIIISILPENRSASLKPIKKVRTILKTLSMEHEMR